MKDARQTTRFRFWLWLIALVGVIVPRRLRADWRQEWEAELRYRETLLTRCIGVFDRYRRFVAERLFGMRETHAVLAKVAARLGGVELVLHEAIYAYSMHIVKTEPTIAGLIDLR